MADRFDGSWQGWTGLGQKIGPGIFLVQAAHQHFELYIYIYSRRTCTGPIVRRPTGKMPGMPDYQSSPGSWLISYKHLKYKKQTDNRKGSLFWLQIGSFN